MRGKEREGRRHRRGTGLLVALGVLVLLGIVIRLVLDPIAAHYTRQALNKNESMRGTFSGVHVSLLPPGYEIHRLKLMEHPAPETAEPIFYAERARISVLWRELLHARLVARAEILRPKVVRPAARAKEEAKEATHKAAEGKPAPDLARLLQGLLPAKLDRLDVEDGEVLVAQGAGAHAPKVWLNHLQLTAENLATRRGLMEGEPSKLRLDGRVQRTGKLSVDGTMNPFAKALTFSVKAALRDLDLRELYAFVEQKSDVVPRGGTADVFLELRARNGVLTGGVKPVLKDVDVKAAKDTLGDRIKAALADTAIQILEDDERPSGHDVVATTIPIKGTVKDPHVQVLPAVLGAVRNGLVVGLASGFSNLPPATSEKKEGTVKQVLKTFQKGEGPPKAEPEPEPRHGRAGQQRPRGDRNKPSAEPLNP